MFLSYSHSSFSITTKCCSVAFVCAAGNSGQWRKRWVLREHLVLHEAHPVGRLGGTRSSHFPQRAHWQQGSDVTWSTLQIILVQTSYCWANFAWSCLSSALVTRWVKGFYPPSQREWLILFISIIQAYRLLILKNKVELAQFQNSAPQYLTLTQGFWKALSSLPLTYDYSAYRRLLQTYGTHYLSEGSLGGEYQALLQLDRQALASTGKNFWCKHICFWY